MVSQTVLTVAGCILVTSFVWADFAWQGASAASVARGGSDLGWEDYAAFVKIEMERRMEISCSPANCAREGACPFVCKGWSSAALAARAADMSLMVLRPTLPQVAYHSKNTRGGNKLTTYRLLIHVST